MDNWAPGMSLHKLPLFVWAIFVTPFKNNYVAESFIRLWYMFVSRLDLDAGCFLLRSLCDCRSSRSNLNFFTFWCKWQMFATMVSGLRSVMLHYDYFDLDDARYTRATFDITQLCISLNWITPAAVGFYSPSQEKKMDSQIHKYMSRCQRARWFTPGNAELDNNSKSRDNSRLGRNRHNWITMIDRKQFSPNSWRWSLPWY